MYSDKFFPLLDNQNATRKEVPEHIKDRIVNYYLRTYAMTSRTSENIVKHLSRRFLKYNVALALQPIIDLSRK